MTRKTIKEILMERDGMISKEADALIREAREAIEVYIDNGDIGSAEEICMEYFDLEPDYIDELL